MESSASIAATQRAAAAGSSSPSVTRRRVMGAKNASAAQKSPNRNGLASLQSE